MHTTAVQSLAECIRRPIESVKVTTNESTSGADTAVEPTVKKVEMKKVAMVAKEAEPKSKEVETAEPKLKEVETAEPKSKEVETAEPKSKEVETAEPKSKVDGEVDIDLASTSGHSRSDDDEVQVDM